MTRLRIRIIDFFKFFLLEALFRHLPEEE